VFTCTQELNHAIGTLSDIADMVGAQEDWPAAIERLRTAEKHAQLAQDEAKKLRAVVGPGFTNDRAVERDRALANCAINLSDKLALDLAFMRSQVQFWSEPKPVALAPCAHCGHTARAHNYLPGVANSECEECSCVRFLTPEDISNEGET
jgi:hypothetical protein